ncbi:hypothetical protein MIND_01326200 [Mycena indigotica]|uniref:Uncharacterized protein n=1 Tax=Mycena indigotica TaxID=2126181 RepID=A0A8H6S260_9AGAR|nr:uncharacterized protein MIND_01326200 [Mycena indigotica]KAF7290850.1 hypothetical protein MIND_01326200 [Mycena indigotica]
MAAPSPTTNDLSSSAPTTVASLTANLSPEGIAKLQSAAAAELQARKLKKASTKAGIAAALDAGILGRIFTFVSHLHVATPEEPVEPEPTPQTLTYLPIDPPKGSKPKSTTHKEKTKAASAKPHRLLSLLLVNKHWNAAGTPLLYKHISLTGQTGTWVARKLRRTLESKKPLVQSILLDAELSMLANDEVEEGLEEETKDHVRIVRVCAESLKEVTVLGYTSPSISDGKLTPYAEALGRCHALTTLNISGGDSGLLTFAELLGLMSGWPLLERMVLKDVLREGNSSMVNPTGCKHLKMVKVIDTFTAEQQISFVQLAQAAPNMTVFWVEQRGKGVLPDDLFDALKLWAGTLEGLCVLTEANLKLETILPSLHALRQLDVTSMVLRPSADTLKAGSAKLTGPSSLSPATALPPANAVQQHLKPPGIHTLTYHHLPPPLLPILTESLSQTDVFPTLRCVVLKNGKSSKKDKDAKQQREKEDGWKGKSKSVYGVPTRDVDSEGPKIRSMIHQVRWHDIVATPPSLVLGFELGYASDAVQALKAVGRRRRIRVVF